MQFFYLLRVLEGSQTSPRHPRKLRPVSRRCLAKQFSLNFWKTTESANFLLLVHIPKVVLYTHTNPYWRSYHSFCVIKNLFLVRQLRPGRRYTTYIYIVSVYWPSIPIHGQVSFLSCLYVMMVIEINKKIIKTKRKVISVVAYLLNLI